MNREFIEYLSERKNETLAVATIWVIGQNVLVL